MITVHKAVYIGKKEDMGFGYAHHDHDTKIWTFYSDFGDGIVVEKNEMNVSTVVLATLKPKNKI